MREACARWRRLRAHAIGELNGLGFYPPGPPSEPAGSPLGDALNALAAAVDCARRNGHLWSIDLPFPFDHQLHAETGVVVTDACRARDHT